MAGDKAAYTRQQEADITWMAKTWERIVGTIEYPTRSFAVETLDLLIQAYLRGQAIRMGNMQSFAKHGWTLVTLAVAVMSRVEDDDAKDIWFDSLVRLGFGDKEKTNETMRDLVGRERGPD